MQKDLARHFGLPTRDGEAVAKETDFLRHSSKWVYESECPDLSRIPNQQHRSSAPLVVLMLGRTGSLCSREQTWHQRASFCWPTVDDCGCWNCRASMTGLKQA